VLRGSGSAAAVPVLVFSPAVTTLDFGSIPAGSVSVAQTVTVLNQGPGGATLTLLNAIGADAASFSVVGGTCAIGAVGVRGSDLHHLRPVRPGLFGDQDGAGADRLDGQLPARC
jgi:hypothetical protein